MNSTVFSPSLLKKSHVCIIGGGIVGCTTAYFLARQGFSVTVLERDTVGSNASGVNFGGVRRHARHEFELPLAIKSHRIWQQLPELVGHDCDLETPGHLKVALKEEEMAVLEAWLPIGKAEGVDVELLGREQVLRRHPWLSGDVAGASFCQGDGFANPRLVAPAFAKAARSLGVRILEGFPVTGVEKSAGKGWIISSGNSDRLQADIVVNASGAWASSFALPLSSPIHLTPYAPQMFVTEPTRIFPLPVLGLVNGKIYLRQSVRGNIIFGGGRGDIRPDGLRSRPAGRPFTETTALMRELIPSLAQVALIRSWTGIEGHTPDGLPVVGQCPTYETLYHAWGFSGHGFQMGPAVGLTLAEVIGTGISDIDLNPFRIDRFSRPAARARSSI